MSEPDKLTNDKAKASDEDNSGSRQVPLDVYAWALFTLLLSMVVCIALLTYAVLDMRAELDARLPPSVSESPTSADTGGQPGLRPHNNL